MVEMGLAAMATLFAVIIVFLHKQWMNGTPVPAWLLHFTCTCGLKSFKESYNEFEASLMQSLRPLAL
jgi:hypothetical protein